MILIHASEVAACVGRNPYKSRVEMLSIVLRRYDVTAFEGSGHEIQEVVDARVVATARSEDLAIDAAINAVENSGIKASVQEVHELIRVGQAAAATSTVGSMTPIVRATVARHCRDEAFRQFGIAKEGDSMRGLEQTVGMLTKDDKYTKRRVNGLLPVFVGGRVDGFATPPVRDGDTVARPTVLVEIKNRMNRLFRRVVEYERIQCLTYMHIFNRRCAKLVERMDEEVAVHDVPFDLIEWTEISSDLQAFAVDVLALVARGKASSALTS